MKKLKLSLVVALIGMASLVGAQNLSFNVKGGLNLSDLSGDVEDNKIKPGFHFGLGADYEFSPNMAIQSGLFFSSKGTKTDDKYESGPTTYKKELTINANFLQLPVHFAYKIDASPGTRVVLHAGPYIAYGIGGKTKHESKYYYEYEGSIHELEHDSEKMDTFDKDEGLKRFDAGLGIGVGAEFGKILIDLGWDMGFVNLGDNDVDKNTQNAYLSVGYKF